MIRLDNFNENISIIKNFLALKTDYITSEWILVLKNIFRKYKEAIEEFEDFLTNITFDSISEIEAKAAYIWILGEFGNEIDMAPYILERMIEIHKDLQSVEISMELLTSITKLFFTRAPETKEMLGKFFKFAIADNIDVDLRDRAFFYYKLLKEDISVAKSIICKEDDKEAKKFLDTTFINKYDSHDKYLREEVLKIKKKEIKVKQRGGKEPKKDSQPLNDEPVEEEKVVAESDDNNLIDFGEDFGLETNSTTKPAQHSDDLFDLDDQKEDDPLGSLIDDSPPVKQTKKPEPESIIDLEDAFSGPGLITPPSPPVVSSSGMNLKQTADLDQLAYQSKWMTLGAFPAITRKVNATKVTTIQAIWDMLSAKFIFCMASGQVNEYF